jgi:hypothetical protein
VAGRIRKIEKMHIRTRSRDLPACSIVPQPTTLPRASGYNSKVTKKLFFAACSMLVCYLAYSSTMMVEMICFSETSADFHRTTLPYIPEDRTRLELRRPCYRFCDKRKRIAMLTPGTGCILPFKCKCHARSIRIADILEHIIPLLNTRAAFQKYSCERRIISSGI